MLFIVGIDKIGKCVFFSFIHISISNWVFHRSRCTLPQPPHFSPRKLCYYWRSTSPCTINLVLEWMWKSLMVTQYTPSAIILYSQWFSQDLEPNRAFSIASNFGSTICFIYIFTSLRCRPSSAYWASPWISYWRELFPRSALSCSSRWKFSGEASSQ